MDGNPQRAPEPSRIPLAQHATPRQEQGQPGWRSRDILRAAALVLGVYLVLRMLWVAQPIIIAAFFGVLFGLAVARGADGLERWRIPRGLASFLIVFGFYGLLAGIFALAAPTLQKQFGDLRQRLPEATDRVETWLERHRGGMVGQLVLGGTAATDAPAAEAPAPGVAQPQPPSGRPGAEPARPGARQGQGQAVPGPGGGPPSPLRRTLTGQLGDVGRYMFRFLSSTVAVITGLLLITFIAIYVAADPRLYHKGLLHLVPRPNRQRAGEVLSAIATTLRRWLLSQGIAMLVIGVVTTVTLMLLGVEAAVSLGIIAGLLEFIPNIGPLIAALPAVAMGFLDSPQKALMVAVAYAAIQFLENQLLIPILMRRGVDLPPVLTLVGQAVMAVVFGFLGLLVAVPIIAAVLVAVKMLYVEDVVGDEVQISGQGGDRD
jgi:predicted PurR-regulated permease PerM